MNFFRNLIKGKQPPAPASAPSNLDSASPIFNRLAEEFAFLQEIIFQRNFRADPSFGKAAEERVIWRELFDLELQELDEQSRRRMRQLI